MLPYRFWLLIVQDPKTRIFYQRIFLLLYSRNGDLVDYKDISRSLGFSEVMVRDLVKKMINKNIANQKIVVAGAGNIGRFVGGLLIAGGRSVSLLCRPGIAAGRLHFAVLRGAPSTHKKHFTVR